MSVELQAYTGSLFEFRFEADPDGLSRLFLDELSRAITPIAGNTDAAIAFIRESSICWLASRKECACSQAAGKLPACRERLQVCDRYFTSTRVDCDSQDLGEVIVCYDHQHLFLPGIIDYLSQTAATRIEREKREELLLEELSASWESLEAVYEVSSDIRATRNSTELLDRIIDRATSIWEGTRAVFWLESEGSLTPLVSKNISDLENRPLQGGLVGKAIAAGSPLVLNDQTKIAGRKGDDVELARATNVAIVPAATRQGLAGALEVWYEGEGLVFDSHSIRLLQTLTLQAVMVTENDFLHRAAIESERLQQEIEIGSKIQQSLLVGKTPEGIAGVKLAALTIPSQYIDGDFYDFIKHSDECMDVLIGDVMGKGIPAALVGAATKTSFLRAMSRESLLSPEEIVMFVHNEMTRQLIALESFSTICYARFDTSGRRVELVDCGHTRTIRFWRRTGMCGTLQGDNMPLGFSDGEIYRQFSIPLEAGDVFLFYSDGITEARNPQGEMFGEERLAELVENYNRLNPQQLLTVIRLAVTSFAGSENLSDDFTLIVVKISGTEDEFYLVRERAEILSNLSELGAARAFVRKVLDRVSILNVSQEVATELELAVNEAVSNIMRHAYRGRADQPVILDASVTADRFTLRLCHRGEVFDPQSVSPPSFDGSRDGGFGLFIIEQLVDELTYGRDASGNNFTCLIKKFSEIRSE